MNGNKIAVDAYLQFMQGDGKKWLEQWVKDGTLPDEAKHYRNLIAAAWIHEGWQISEAKGGRKYPNPDRLLTLNLPPDQQAACVAFRDKVMAEIRKAIAGEIAYLTTFDHACKVMRVVDAAYRSAVERCTVRIAAEPPSRKLAGTAA